MELQSRYADLKQQGIGLVVVTYDSTEILKKFADTHSITYPLVSDPGSAIIKRYGLLNESQDPTGRGYGVPHPGTFMLNTRGVITSRHFEDAYQERSTVASILTKEGLGGAPAIRSDTMHLTVLTSISDAEVAPGKRVSLAFDVTPKRLMHVYAPGKHDYQVIDVRIDSQPWLKKQPLTYPPSEIYHFKELDEKVETYGHPFKLVQDVTFLATPAAQKQLAGMPTATIKGTLEYQACDDKVCYAPTRVPFSFTVDVIGLTR